jgi:iron(II)-dependent oxidoreductase
MPTDVATGEALVSTLGVVRERTLALVAHLRDEDLERVLHPLMSPLVWDLGHIAAYEDLWLAHRFGGLELLRPDLAAFYDAFETPRAVRGDLEILGHADARAYLDAVRDRVLQIAERNGTGDGTLFELVLRHELQHTETMRQAMALGGLLPAGEPGLREGPAGADHDFVRVGGGTFAMGAGDDGFAYDNERPRHARDVPPFHIARRPVTEATWATFAEGGGYERREWWSDEGWAWKEEYDITHKRDVAAAPGAPVCHVSWFEAAAFARSCGARLPTEAEWEKAATWDQGGVLDGVGSVWEWTSSHLTGYPGFRAHPYREYSEVFFGDGYRVLRGGSWATHPRVATRTFRNWDLPQRRQIFAGVRLARDEI